MGLMELFNCTLILLLFASLLTGTSHASDIEPIVLTDGTFEHDTQASTGQTTGIWAIRFCSGGQAQTGQQDNILSSCSQTDSVWKRLAADLLESENIIVADVRVGKEKGLLKRFEEQFVVPHNSGDSKVLKRHPVVIMFRQRQNMYVKDWILPKGVETYDDERVFEEMRTWITTGWETASSPVDVPSEPSWYHDIPARLSSIQFTQQIPSLYFYSYISIAVAIIVLLIVRKSSRSLKAATKRD